MWSESYRPKSLEEMIGNNEVRAKLVVLLSKWKKGTKAVLLVGPPGTGKTTAVQLAAKKLSLNLVQLNASDRRTKDMLSQKLGEALVSTTLFGGKTLVFLDEVDGLAGRADFGAVDFIKEAVRNSQHPIVMAANDPDSDEVRKLASATTSLLFVKPSVGEVKERLRVIAKKQKLSFTEQELNDFAASAKGDVRAAINALQGGVLVTKDEEMSASQALNAFFCAAGEKEALKALRSYPRQPRDKIRDLFTSLVHSKIHEEKKAKAMEVLSRVDLLVGRMAQGRDWRLLRYLDPLLAYGLQRALRGEVVRFSSDSTLWSLQLRIWNDSRKLKDIGTLAGRRLGISQKGFMVADMPYVMLLCREATFRDEFVGSLGLGENYAAFITKEAGRPVAP
jgi:replication factor C large subunit